MDPLFAVLTAAADSTVVWLATVGVAVAALAGSLASRRRLHRRVWFRLSNVVLTITLLWLLALIMWTGLQLLHAASGY